MQNKIICFGAMTVLATLVILPSASAGECEYGKVKAWARTLNDSGEWGKWRNATVHENLKVHEPFQIKVEVITKTECSVSSWLSRAGVTEAYKTISGPSNISEHMPPTRVPSGWNATYKWTIAPTGNWTEGTAALNIRSQFHVPDDDKFVDFTIIAAYIEPEEWDGNDGNGNGTGDNENATGNDGNGIPGFEGMLLGLSIIVAIMTIWVRKGERY